MISVLLVVVFFHSITADDLVHNPIQYHSQTPRGSYNYGYDTGLYGSHQFHQENKDNHGVVRGRYGYTDPDGKLRLTYYTAGPDGYNVIKDTTPADRTPVQTVAVQTVAVHSPAVHAPAVHAAPPHVSPSVHARSHHHPPLVVTAPCKYRNPPCHQARVHQEPEKVNSYSEKSTHHEQKITTEIRSHPPAPVVHAQSTPQEHNHHHLHHRNHDSHTQTTPTAPSPQVVHTPVVEVRHPVVEARHLAVPTRVHHEDTVNTHTNTITKTVVDAPVESQIIHQAPIAVKAAPPVVQQIHQVPVVVKGPQVVHAIKAPPVPVIVQTPVAVKAPPPVIHQQAIHQDTVGKVHQDTIGKVHQDTIGKVHRSPVQVYRGKTAVPPTKYEEYAKGRYVPNYKPSSPYSRCWCE